MKFIRNTGGFTLAEVVVASGLLGMIGLGVMYGTRTLQNMEKGSKQSSALQSYNSVGLNKLKVNTQGLSWEKLNFKATYVQHNLNKKIKSVDWGFPQLPGANTLSDLEVTISDNQGNNYNVSRDSHTLVYSKNGKLGVYFSRCIPKRKYYEKKITPSIAFGLKRVPYLVKEGKKNGIYCCPKNSTNLCSSSVLGPSSPYRFLTFELRDQGAFKVSPNHGDSKFFLGSGFMVYLNRAQNPDAFKALYFNIADSCYRDNDKNSCNKNGIMTVRAVNGEISSKSVFESGQLIIQ